MAGTVAQSPETGTLAIARRWFQRRPAGDRSRWARRALDWPLVNYLEGAVWLLVAVTLAVSYYGSYDNLVDVLAALGYANGPSHVVPVALDAPLTCSVIGQFLLARWKSPAVKRWRLFAVSLVTAPLSLAGNALHGALRFDAEDNPSLDLALLDLHRPEVVIRLVAAMVPGIGIILAVAVTELVLRERARLEELRDAERPEVEQWLRTDQVTIKADANGTAPAIGGRERSGRRPAAEVLALVNRARADLVREHEREPSDQEVAARVSADGHPISASRVRTYLAQLRAVERSGTTTDGERAGGEIAPWHAG